jgi:hypothetical protein
MKKFSNFRIVAAAVVAAGSMLIGAPPANAQWRSSRSDGANSSFARIDTVPARDPRIVQVGGVAPGANPVIGPDGKVYVGTAAGELRAFHPDGAPYWTRRINAEHGGIHASPVVGSDGSIYVVSTLFQTESPDKLNQTFLHKFNAGGAWLFSHAVPKADIYPFNDGGLANAAPNIWQWNGSEAVIVPVLYRGLGRESVNLLAFAPNGALVGRQQMSIEVYEISGGADWQAFAPYCFALNIWNFEVGCFVTAMITGGYTFESPDGEMPLKGAGFPMAQVAIHPDPQGGAPRVFATDRKHAKVLYSFSPGAGFVELSRIGSGRHFATSPMVMPNGLTMVGTVEGFLTRTSATGAEASAQLIGIMTASPTRHKDGSIVVVSRDGYVRKVGPGITSIDYPGGESIVSAAASCTHVYVSTTSGLYTYDAKTMQRVAAVNWSSGGLNAPVIGMGGRIYAIAGQFMFVFPGPFLGDTVGRTACDVLAPAYAQ